MSDSPQFDSLLNHIESLFSAPSQPAIPPELTESPAVAELHEKLAALREILAEFAKGDLSMSINMKGFIPGALKALQSHLRHLTWQVQQVEKGDFSQRIDFLGEFSEAFNSMVLQLDHSYTALRQKEEALTTLANTLQKEVELRNSAVIALKQSEAKFRYLAEHDPLTGALNRRSFHSLAVAELQSSYLAKVPCCIALLDVDNFKKFNDTYGHLNGDIALKEVVKSANACLRQSDALGRFGGEEFIFFLASVNLQQGVSTAERIRQRIESTPIPLAEGGEMNITASIGVSVALPEWFSPKIGNALFQYLVGQADDALYNAKSKGRNRVHVAPTIPPSNLTPSKN